MYPYESQIPGRNAVNKGITSHIGTLKDMENTANIFYVMHKGLSRSAWSVILDQWVYTETFHQPFKLMWVQKSCF